MTGFFADEIQQARLLGEARSWIGTPFVPHAGIRGAGVDCVHLCASIYIELGALQKFDPPRYSVDGGPNGAEPLVIGWIEGSGRFDRIPKETAIGDLICFAIGRREYHVGILITPRTFVHCARGHGCIESWLTDPTYGSRLTAIYRPLEWEASA